MASNVGTTLVIFIAAVGLAGVVAAGLSGAIGNMAQAMNDRGQTLSEAIATDLKIVNDPENVPFDSGTNTLTIYVKNTGSRDLVEEDLTILLNGQFETFSSRMLGETDDWAQGTILEANVTENLSSGDHRVRALYTPNIADELEFRVE